MESIQQDSLVDVTGDRVETISNQDQPAKGTAQSFDDLFVLDTTGDETVEIPNLPPPKIPSLRASPEISDSSDEEVIVFKGRANRHVVQPPTSSRPNPISTIHPADNTAGSSVEGPSSQGNDRIDIEVAHDPQPEKGSKSKRRRTRAVDKEAEEEEDAILADYIANMAEDSDNDDFLSSALRAFAGGRDLGGDHHAVNFGSDHEISPYNQDVANEEKSKASEDSEAGSDAEQMEDGDMDEDIISQLITKHEALEIGDNDLFSFMTSHTKLKTKTNYRQRPSASQVADALDSLDLGDWDQMAAAQSRKRKGKKQPPKFNVDDPEIEAALRIAWQKDRERKKERKLEREALRAEGLLGKNANPDSLSVKYPTGMKLEDMKAELCSFLLGDVDRLEFPPLDKHARKILHELASKFEIKSQSIGSGDQRRPVLHRTKRTIRFSDLQCKEVSIHVDKAATRIYRKYFHRTDLKGGGEGKNSPKPAGGRSSYKALTPREGEIVGASVPELGADNKGRAMLEKMGWTKGMALGAADNKGILVPVVQVVKRSKAGLG
ncbi:hypothetical protein VTJ04DRAFT_10637 [Mycothermus thermophilus]|uniref:uncharacterized protein n=1 Tax=Humicola insolens TaxID=85995 RepID=UPI0037433ADE